MRYYLLKYNPEYPEILPFAMDSGGYSATIWEEDGKVIIGGPVPEVGKCIRVGSLYARTMQWQDWWQTSYIEEILEDTKTDEERSIKFRTKSNSHYIWKEELS
jgi:hypothetical protein